MCAVRRTLDHIQMEILDSLYFFFADFLEPKKRVFVGYLLISVMIAFAWLFFIRNQSVSNVLRKIFDKKVFFSASARTDYKIFAINRLVTSFISPLLVTQLAIATAIFYALHSQGFVFAGQFGETHEGVVIALFTLTLFVIDDFTKYILHRWMHRWPVLWAIHKIHHSAKTLTPVTVYRVHPLEGILYTLRNTVAQGAVVPVFIFLFGDKVDLVTVVGANIFAFMFHVTGSNLRHSHISIRYWPWLEHILISPAQHQIHHSVAEEHFDRNFGAALAVWDWMFGSLHLSEAGRELTFGLDAREKTSENDLKTIYGAPFIEISTLLQKRFSDARKVEKPREGVG